MLAAALALIAAGCLGLALLALRSLGPNYRVARLLAATPEVALSEAAALAVSGPPRYVRVRGRISSEEEFPDEHERPLVYRRTRIEIADERGRWQRVSEDREAVDFGIGARMEFIAVDSAVLGNGLIVVPREAYGTAQDLPEQLRNDHPAAARSRLVIEQVSAVEQAIAAGVPSLGADGTPRLSAGLGRPLILTTVEIPAAMRLLAREARPAVLAATALLAVALAFVLLSVIALLAAS